MKEKLKGLCILVSFFFLQCKSAVDLMANIIYIRWRCLLTAHIQRLYFSNRNYYKLNVIEKVVDNP